MRHALAALLTVVLALAGAGRGIAAAADVPIAPPSIAGFVFPICHAEAADDKPANPGGHLHHDCCDTCALCNVFINATPPTATLPEASVHDAPPAALKVWIARVARARTPRQSQGPPAA